MTMKRTYPSGAEKRKLKKKMIELSKERQTLTKYFGHTQPIAGNSSAETQISEQRETGNEPDNGESCELATCESELQP